ncbi:hypothetical protein IW147_004173 [Coemansia sp. RSA 720]|nr:hypothetical protein IW147_004173 [Coemansia sp. RSA 720]
MLPDLSFSILETTVYTPSQGVYLLDQHLTRMRESARQLSELYNVPCFSCANVESEHVHSLIRAQIDHCDSNQKYRVRMLLSHTGQLSVQVTPEPSTTSNEPPVLVLDCQPTNTDSVFVRCKTTHRLVYTDAVQRIPAHYAQGTQVLLYNEQGMITEGNIANVAVSMPDSQTGQLALFTPPVAAGLLPGTMRQHLLDTGQIKEAPITVDQFKLAVHNHWPVMCMNSVRGLYAVTPVVCEDIVIN